GTAFFMAIEIQRQTYMYRPAASKRLPPLHSNQKQPGRPPQPNPKSGVIHNFEHDMESVFWVLLWTLLVRFPPARSDAQKAAFSKALSSIFQNSGSCSPDRENLFTNFHQIFETFLGTWLNPALESMQSSLLNLREALEIGYHMRGYDFNDRASYAPLYAYLWEAIRACGQVKLPPSLTTKNTEVYPALVKMKRRGSAQDDKNNPKSARVEYNTDATSARMTEPLDPEVQFQRENA
ncbi:hypothetical protein FS837_006323, partial [Tulasnella sp. UAMH 9824]